MCFQDIIYKFPGSLQDYTEVVKWLVGVLVLVVPAFAAHPILPLHDVRAGMHGTGKTVFSGGRIEDFQVEILGVLENVGPRESLILGRLSGGPLEHTGVMQGMSGSPVYVDGKLVGAVAMAFPYAKDPIAGIRPIEEILRVASLPGQPRPPRPTLAAGRFLPERERGATADSRMTEVATPLSFSGFTAGAIERFAPGLKALGLEPRQGISLGGAKDLPLGDPSKLEPGAMISVELMTGDMSMGADGTVTAIDGDKVYAFGHRFLGVGPADLPFARSEVLTLLANVNTSFKISAAKELMGVISQDRNTAILGVTGKRAAMLPLDISVAEDSKNAGDFHMRIVNDRFLSPYLMQMAVFSAIDSTLRTTGASSIAVNGTVEFENGRDPARIRNIYAADGSSALAAATNTAIPLSYIMQAGFESMKIRRIAISLETSNLRKDLTIGDVVLSRKEAKPGDTVELMVLLGGQNGVELSRSVKYTVPPGAEPGTLNFTVADGTQTSLAELRQIVTETPRSPEQVVSNVNRLRSSDKAYVRVWRADPAYEVGGEDFFNPPPSLALVLGGAPALAKSQNSKLAEFAVGPDGMMITGTRTVQLEIKE